MLGFPKSVRLKGDKAFGLLLLRGKRKTFPGGEIFWRENDLKISRFGLRVSSSAGIAVLRTAIRRRVREMVRKNQILFRPGRDYLVVIKNKNLFPTLPDNKMADYLFSLFGPDVLERVS